MPGLHDHRLRSLVPILLLGMLTTRSFAADQLEAISVDAEGDEFYGIPDAPLGASIKGKTLETVPGAGGDPLRALQAFPGITVTDDTSAAPAIRGSRPGDNLYQVDFLPAGHLFHSRGAISVFNASLIQSIDLYPSAYPSEFSGVIGAAIDVKLRDPKTDRLHKQIDINFLHGGFLAEGPINERQSFYLAGRISYLDLLLKGQLDTEDDGLTFEQFPAYSDYQGKYLWNLENGDQVRLQLNGASDEESILIDRFADDIDNEPDLAGRHSFDSRYHTQGLVWDHRLSQEKHLRSAIAHSTSVDASRTGGAGEVNSNHEQWLIKAHLTAPLNSKHELKTGAELTQDMLSYEATFNDVSCTEFEVDCTLSGQPKLRSKSSLTIAGYQAFIRDAWYITDRLTLETGLTLQGENYLDKRFIEPHFSMEYSLQDDWLLSAGAGQYHQRPAFSTVEKVFGNPDLDYLESDHVVAGIEHLASHGWYWKSELYYKQFNKLVTGHAATRYTNGGKGTAWGLETMIRKNLTRKWSGWASITLARAERENTTTGVTFPFDYDQPVNLSLVAQYQLSPRWMLGAKWWYHSGSPYTEILGGTLDPDDPTRYDAVYGKLNDARLPAYSRLDLRADRQINVNWGKLSAYFELLNALNNENLQGYDYNHDYTLRTGIKQLPRIISLGLKAEF
ncbi:MAG: TonB-dependent receptor plug domain-containing protein [bacterium]